MNKCRKTLKEIVNLRFYMLFLNHFVFSNGSKDIKYMSVKSLSHTFIPSHLVPLPEGNQHD